jgi:hypothetical protein
MSESEVSEKYDVAVYISTYALSQGLLKVMARIMPDGDTVEVMTPLGPVWHTGRGQEWHLTLNGAYMRAREMRRNRIAGLRDEIKECKLEIDDLKRRDLLAAKDITVAVSKWPRTDGE